MTEARRLHGAFYLLALLPLAIGGVLATTAFLGMMDDIKAMPRMEVPGERELQLEAREYIMYGEISSVVDGKAIATGSFRANCRLADAETDEQVDLTTSSTSTTYTMGGYSGQSMFNVEIPKAGTYVLACDGGPGVVAIGTGIGAAIGMAIGGILGGIALGIVVFFLVRRRRKIARTT